MLTASDPAYLESKSIKLGEKRIDKKFEVFADWINVTYNAEILNIFIDTLEDSCTRIKLIFERESALAQFFVKDQFTITYHQKRKIIKKYKALFEDDPIQNTLLLIYSFEQAAKSEVNESISWQIIENFISPHKNTLWEVSRFGEYVTFFFYTKQQVAEAMKTNLVQDLSVEYVDLLKPSDQFNYFTVENLKARFDNKEDFDKHYNGSWYAYYR